MKIRANGLDIEVEDTANINPQDADLKARPAVLLIMGLGMQLVAWPPQMVQELVDAGYRVIRFDNRDIGLSTHFDHLGRPRLLWAMLKHRLGLKLRVAYTLSEMAADALGVLDALEIRKAHIVGVSMGGMIAQRVAIAAPERVLSLTSIMSSSGARGLPEADRAVLRVMVSRPEGASVEAAVQHSLKMFKAIGSPAYPSSDEEMRERIERGVQRSYHPEGMLRQMMAVVADTKRAEQLARVKAPTLVVHGTDDPLVPFACGEDTASRITGAELVAIEGMGHDLPAEPLGKILEALIPHLQSADVAH